MIVEVDAGGAIPPYEQIRVQIATMIDAGTLVEGTQLPTIRQLANDLAVAPGTVARAYTELERSGLVRSRRRGGTVVEARATPSESARLAQLAEAARSYALVAHRLGATSSAAVKVLREQIAELPDSVG